MGDRRRGRRRPGVRARPPALAPGAAPRRLAAGQLGRVLGARHGARRQPGRRRRARRAACCSSSGRPARSARSTAARTATSSGLVFSPDSGLARLVAPRPAPAAPAQARQHHRPVGHRGDPAALPGLRARRSPSTASTSRSCPTRAFDPVYDEHVFDLAFVGGARPHLITLAATTPPRSGRSGTAGPSRRRDKDETPGQRGRPPPPAIDLEGLADRIVPFPVEAARYSNAARRQGRRAVAAPPGRRRARRLPGHPRRPATRRPTWSATTSPSGASSISPSTPTTSRSAATASGCCCGPTAS